MLEEYDDAINVWKESISLQPSSPDAHLSNTVPILIVLFTDWAPPVRYS